MIGDLRAAAERAAAGPSVRVIVVRGAGASFCAGLDLAELGAQRAAGAVETHGLEHALEILERCPRPTLAAVHGDAIAGGCELALHCDLRVAADTARFAMPLARIGLAVPVTLTWKLVEVIGAPALLRGERGSKEGRRPHLHRERDVAFGPSEPLHERRLRRELPALQSPGVLGAERHGALRTRRILRAEPDHHPPLAVLVGQAELERAFQRREPLDAGRGQVGRTRWCAHAETGPDERLPVGAALRQPDERRPRRGALDADVLALHLHVP